MRFPSANACRARLNLARYAPDVLIDTNLLTPDAASLAATIIVALYIPFLIVLGRAVSVTLAAKRSFRHMKTEIGVIVFSLLNLAWAELLLLGVVNSGKVIRGSDAQSDWFFIIVGILLPALATIGYTILLGLNDNRANADDDS
jgi:hypothetical protein